MVARKTAPAKKAIAGKDDITEWQNNQPVVTVIKDENADDYFPSGDESEATTRTEERPPNIPSPIASKARALVSRAKASATKPSSAKPKTPKPRTPVDKLIGTVWQFAAQLTAPINMPVARVLDMQAPVAGMLLEDEIKNTVVDRILQPIARIEDGGETAFALLGPPLLVAAITQWPNAAPILVPLLRQSMMSWIEIAGPKLEAVKKKEAQFQEKYGQRVDEMIGYFLSAIPETSANGSNPAHQTAANTATT